MAYLISVYLYATAFVSDRYASTLMLFRYALSGFGLALCFGRWLNLGKGDDEIAGMKE